MRGLDPQIVHLSQTRHAYFLLLLTLRLFLLCPPAAASAAHFLPLPRAASRAARRMIPNMTVFRGIKVQTEPNPASKENVFRY